MVVRTPLTVVPVEAIPFEVVPLAAVPLARVPLAVEPTAAGLLLEGVVLRLQADLRWLEACEQYWTSKAPLIRHPGRDDS